MKWSACDKEFHYELYVNGMFICYFCSRLVVYNKIKDLFKKEYKK